jgi:hypothetical protein
LSELNAQLDKQGYYKAFPPPGVEVVSWYVMMGIGQVVTRRAARHHGFGKSTASSRTPPGAAIHTEFYSTYDYKAVGVAQHDKAQ